MVQDDAIQRSRSEHGNLGYLMRLAQQSLHGALTGKLAPFGLSVPQYGALSVFDSIPELSSAELARFAAVKPQSMNTIVHQLLERDLLERGPAPNHGKIVLLRLSKRGRKLLDRATAAVRIVEQQALQGLSEPEKQLILTWLARTITIYE